MFKLVVLFALVAVAVAAPKPGYLHGGAVAYSAPVVAHSAVAVPTAVSHSSRVDVHSSPVVATTYTAPAVVAAPVVHAAPAVAVHAAPAIAYASPALSSAVSHSSRVDLHRSAAVIAAPLAAHGYGYAGLGYSGLGYAAPLAHGYAAGVPAIHAW